MELLESYRRAAEKNGRDAFVHRYDHLFFVKRPAEVETPPDGPSDEGEFRFKTRLTSTQPTVMDSRGPFTWQWRLARIVKREGNPFPERISIGRAGNCDVVLRLPFISKLHAIVLLDGEGGHQIMDQNSSNGVVLNGKRLPPEKSHAFAPGDRLAFGFLEVEVMDAGGLCDLLLSGAVSS